MAIDFSRKPKTAITPAPARRWSLPRLPSTGDTGSAFLGVLWRRKVFVLGFVAIAAGLTYAYVSGITPRYEAETHVRIESRGLQPIDPRTDASAVQGLAPEVLLIESRALAERLVDDLNLHLLPEFNPALAPARPGVADGVTLLRLLPGPLAHRLPDSWIDGLASRARGGAMTDVERAEFVRSNVVEAVRGRVAAAPQDGTTIIALRFRAADPELAALAVNTLAEGYLEERGEQRDLVIERTAAFLSREIERLRERIDQTEAEIAAHRQSLGLSVAEPAQVSELSSQLVVARGERMAAETRLRETTRLLRSDPDLWAATDALDSPVIAELRDRKAEVNRRKAELTGDLAVATLEFEEDELARSMREELSRSVEALRTEVDRTLARERDLQVRLIELKRRLDSASGATGELRVLQRRAEGDRALLETYMTRAVELRSLQGAEAPDARVIARAVIPDAPVYPPRALALGVAVGLALVAGSVIAVGLERMDDTFRSGQQIEEAIRLPALGLLPAVADAGRGGLSPEHYVIEKPNSRFGEAVRSLRTALLRPRAGAPPKVLLFTSSVPGEGKTSMALSLARVNATAGQRTLIIDADLRRPRLHEACGVANGQGLSELLTGAPAVDDVLHTDEPSGLSLITAGGSVADPAALLAGEPMRTLLERLARRFELIVLDSPPVLSVSDARVLAQLAEKTVFLVRWGHTPRHDAMSGVRQLTDAGADVAGVVLSRVDVRKHARYGYRDSGYYHDRRYTSYYKE